MEVAKGRKTGRFRQLDKGEKVYTLSPHLTGPRPDYIPSRLTRLVPALTTYPLASPEGQAVHRHEALQ
eukprot:5097937-Pyramimonas_sp.AAC.1